MPNGIDLLDMSNEEVLALLVDCLETVSFDEAWSAIMQVWDRDDQEEAQARLEELLDATEEDE
jgi:hypothetical protein